MNNPDAPVSVLASLRKILPVKGRQTEVGGELWARYANACDDVTEAQDRKDRAETEIRQLDPQASVLTVDGEKVAVRVRSEVKSASWVKDFYRRRLYRDIPQKGNTQ